MAKNNESSNNNVFSANDPLDINELASLNEEISNDFIEQLQNKITESVHTKNDGDLFEEVQDGKSNKTFEFNKNIDDNFIKKYKAKLRKREGLPEEEVKMPEHSEKEEEPEVKMPEHSEKPVEEEVKMPEHSVKDEEPAVEMPEHSTPTVEPEPVITSEEPAAEYKQEQAEKDKNSIENISGGNIIEKPIPQSAPSYDDSLDYLDSNVNYTKYVVYIDPENKEFIDSLTVKERKNLINRIIREQDAIALTKRRLGKIQMIVTHAIVAILTVTIAIPFIYWTINTSLETTINNYRNSQTIFGQLYKEKGKIKNIK